MSKSNGIKVTTGKGAIGQAGGPQVVSNGFISLALNVLKGFGKPHK